MINKAWKDYEFLIKSFNTGLYQYLVIYILTH